ncbi:hypothetical protein F751_1365 [Auxenochlorella protothecoides]|uniref:Protein FAM136A n=1 Tax=Auxenochlorella protothecoides TaxID=3075 RepID=A0A087SEE6_AUXPR|nr:hypothetical protein F751_1365 [Auxenochlorella protothecoides]KFM24100.1 hypothetical protein F751_1365 [Auxenochlorella protothecoides]RMZ55294.1 hypothetical protein APUTEX25_003432 [Auxenochlorella protothecoides]|eukprot:RMZ55294.1 hypothetical protein APUTEX25_003432 [Auxenochlorella protothecoides]
MAGPEQRADSLRQSMEKMVTRLDKDNLRPVQKESYLCMARCCDTAAGPAELQQCANRCEQGVHVKHSIIQSAMADFQNRVQRCVQRCQDAAQESLPIKPSEKDIARAQDKLANCAADCAQEYERQIPKLEKSIVEQLARA